MFGRLIFRQDIRRLHLRYSKPRMQRAKQTVRSRGHLQCESPIRCEKRRTFWLELSSDSEQWAYQKKFIAFFSILFYSWWIHPPNTSAPSSSDSVATRMKRCSLIVKLTKLQFKRSARQQSSVDVIKCKLISLAHKNAKLGYADQHCSHTLPRRQAKMGFHSRRFILLSRSYLYA